MSLYQLLEQKRGGLFAFPQKENHGGAAIGREGWLPTRRKSVVGAGRRPVVEIAVIYESDLNRERAERMQEELARRLGKSFAFSVSWWSLESLEHSETRRVAARSIAEANVICFSLLSGGEIPRHVATWLDQELLGRKARRVCLLALVEAGGAAAPRLSRAEVYLSQLSLAAGVDCLCYSDTIPTVRSVRSKRDEKHARGGQGFLNSVLMVASLRRLARAVDWKN